jgi:hypothetical protein
MSLWYLLLLISLAILITPIVMASGWRPGKPSLPKFGRGGGGASFSFWGCFTKVTALIILAILTSCCIATLSCGKKLGSDMREGAKEQIRPSEFPVTGNGIAEKGFGLKCWLDPMKSYTRPSGPARYQSAENPAKFWDDTSGKEVESQSSTHYQAWLRMPAGRYVVYPLGDEPIIFFWGKK